MEESVEINDCYICTDPTNDHSPCQCKIPVHMPCLLEWIEKNDNNRLVCSVCNMPFKGIELPEKKTVVTCTINTSRLYNARSAETQCLLIIYFILRILYYLSMGYLGKYIIAISLEPGLIHDTDYWSPFDFVFFLCATCGCLVTLFIFNLRLKLKKYLSRGQTNYYEEFTDSDSDNDGINDSVV